MARQKFCCPIFQHTCRLHLIVKRLLFGIWDIIIGLIIDIVDLFQDEGFDVFVIRTYKFRVIKVAVTSTEENYLIVDRGGTAYVVELGHGFKPPVTIHIPIWCVMDFPVQWNAEVDVFGVLIGLVHNDGWQEALTIGSGKDKSREP